LGFQKAAAATLRTALAGPGVAVGDAITFSVFLNSAGEVVNNVEALDCAVLGQNQLQSYIKSKKAKREKGRQL
jgi:hypothetical protein